MNRFNKIYLLLGGALLPALILGGAMMLLTHTRKITKPVMFTGILGLFIGGLLSYKMLEVYKLNFELFKNLAGYTGDPEDVKR